MKFSADAGIPERRPIIAVMWANALMDDLQLHIPGSVTSFSQEGSRMVTVVRSRPFHIRFQIPGPIPLERAVLPFKAIVFVTRSNHFARSVPIVLCDKHMRVTRQRCIIQPNRKVNGMKEITIAFAGARHHALELTTHLNLQQVGNGQLLPALSCLCYTKACSGTVYKGDEWILWLLIVDARYQIYHSGFVRIRSLSKFPPNNRQR